MKGLVLGIALVLVSVAVIVGCTSTGPATGINVAPDENGVLFEWDSATWWEGLIDPKPSALVAGITTPSAPLASGTPYVDFRAFNTSIPIRDGAFDMRGANNHRLLVFGATSTVQTTADGPLPGHGVFDLSEGTFRLTINYENPTDTPSGWMFRVSINNNNENTASGSVLSFTGDRNQSIIRTFMNTAQIANGRAEFNHTPQSHPGVLGSGEPGTLVLTFTPSVTYAGLATSSPRSYNTLRNAFFAIGCSGNAGITITGIKLEKIN
jgi:hypothetical protein